MDLFGRRKGLEKKVKLSLKAAGIRLLEELRTNATNTYESDSISGDGVAARDYDGAVRNLIRELQRFGAKEAYLSDIDLNPPRMGLTKGPKISVIAYRPKTAA